MAAWSGARLEGLGWGFGVRLGGGWVGGRCVGGGGVGCGSGGVAGLRLRRGCSWSGTGAGPGAGLRKRVVGSVRPAVLTAVGCAAVPAPGGYRVEIGAECRRGSVSVVGTFPRAEVK